MLSFPTKAKATPWHPKLEFRGQGGVLVLPPSVHPSGQRYVWSPGQSLDEVPLPAPPPLIAAAWNPPAKLPPVAAVSVSVHHQLAASPSTQEFLAGKWVNGPGWNDRLFLAACDLCGRRMSREEAELLLLAGAQPWDEVEQEKLTSDHRVGLQCGSLAGNWLSADGPSSVFGGWKMDLKVRLGLKNGPISALGQN